MTSPLRLLIVGDSPNDATRIAQTLRRAGHRLIWRRVDTAGTLTAALSERDWVWDAITCEWGMPRLHHLSALHIARALAPRTPVILVAKKVAGKDGAAHALPRGAHGVIGQERLQDLAGMIARRGRDPATRE